MTKLVFVAKPTATEELGLMAVVILARGGVLEWSASFWAPSSDDLSEAFLF